MASRDLRGRSTADAGERAWTAAIARVLGAAAVARDTDDDIDVPGVDVMRVLVDDSAVDQAAAPPP